MNEIKIIFVDIDHTLFDHNKNEYTPSGIEALVKARNKGVKVIICSARPYSSLNYLGVFKNVPHDGYICVNGGIVNCEDNYIIKNVINKDFIYNVEKICNEHDILLQIVPLRDVFQNREVNEYFLEFKKTWIQPTPRIKKYEGEECASLILFGEKIISDLFKDITEGYFFNFCPGGYDIYLKKYEKSQGIKAALKYYGFSKEEAMAIGDDFNDIEMFKTVKYSVCMGNGRAEVKKEAKYITENIDNDGVKKALIHYNVI